jgi:hypothetical protein
MITKPSTKSAPSPNFVAGVVVMLVLAGAMAYIYWPSSPPPVTAEETQAATQAVSRTQAPTPAGNDATPQDQPEQRGSFRREAQPMK